MRKKFHFKFFGIFITFKFYRFFYIKYSFIDLIKRKFSKPGYHLNFELIDLPDYSKGIILASLSSKNSPEDDVKVKNANYQS